MSRPWWNLLIAVVIVLGVGWIWASRVPAGGAAAALPPAPAVGHPAPDFTLSTVDGQRLTLSSLRGKPVILNFWATWCPPCRAEAPDLEAASRHYAGQVAVLGVDQAEPVAVVQSFAAQNGLTYPVPLDGDGRAGRAYGVRSLPTTFFIDRQGIIRQIQVGPLTQATLAQSLAGIYP